MAQQIDPVRVWRRYQTLPKSEMCGVTNPNKTQQQIVGNVDKWTKSSSATFQKQKMDV